MHLTVEDFDRALAELEIVEQKMPNVFSGVGQSDLISITNDIMHTVTAWHSRGKPIMYHELLRLHYHNASRDDMNKAIDTLIGIRYCKWKKIGEESPYERMPGMYDEKLSEIIALFEGAGFEVEMSH